MKCRICIKGLEFEFAKDAKLFNLSKPKMSRVLPMDCMKQ